MIIYRYSQNEWILYFYIATVTIITVILFFFYSPEECKEASAITALPLLHNEKDADEEFEGIKSMGYFNLQR
ncbi:MAG TPA: hypothetical protein DHV72_19990 [Serratia grimesii]|uniref:Uncharacterized protein n=1 Tax=Serratia grimesii TaxID=82995 RepID=A0A9C7V9G1_9GAMM|nr:hypothetical protein [Serratia grimesii]